MSGRACGSGPCPGALRALVLLGAALLVSACDAGGGGEADGSGLGEPAADTRVTAEAGVAALDAGREVRVAVDAAPPADLSAGATDVPAAPEAGEPGGDAIDAATPPICDEASCPAADCLRCDESGACVSVCDPLACELCDGAGDCSPACSSLACEVCDGEGSCASTCGPNDFCWEDGSCCSGCEPECSTPNAAGYCPAAVVSDLRLAPAPRESTGEPGCCCDFDGDGEVDNGLAEWPQIMCFVMPCPTIESVLREALESGALLILLEAVPRPTDEDEPAVFDLNVYLGADPDGDPSNNFTGEARLAVARGSLDGGGEPLIVLPAAVSGGRLDVAPVRLLLPIWLASGAPFAPLVLSGVAITGNVAAAEADFAVGGGEICGLLTNEAFFAFLNTFVVQSCGCLGLSGTLIDESTSPPRCREAPADQTCSPDDPVEAICRQLEQFCGVALSQVTRYDDVDTGGDAEPDALSFGFYFSAVPVEIIGVAAP